MTSDVESIPSNNISGPNRARAAAKSTVWNPRNLELPWYAFWTRALSRVAALVDVDRSTVSPQFPLWRIWTADDTGLGEIAVLEDEDEDDEEMADEDEDSIDEEKDITDEDSDDNRTVSSINETISIKTRSRITDFALTLLVENDDVNPDKDDDSDEDFIIDKQIVTALIEIKRAASRRLTGEALLAAQGSLLYHAQEAVFRQALYMFANRQWSHQDDVLVIAATGDLWTYTVISRREHLSRMAGADGTNPDWEPNSANFDALPWSTPAIWGKADDSGRIDEVVTWITEHFT